MYTDISRSIEPLIMGVPPLPTSKHLGGRRFFANGQWDRLGLSRLEQVPGNDNDCATNQPPKESGRSGGGNNSAPRDHSSRNPSQARHTSSKPSGFESDSSSDSYLVPGGKPAHPRRTTVAISGSSVPQPSQSGPSGPEVIDISMSDDEKTTVNRPILTKPLQKTSAKRKFVADAPPLQTKAGTPHVAGKERTVMPSSRQHEGNLVRISPHPPSPYDVLT